MSGTGWPVMLLLNKAYRHMNKIDFFGGLHGNYLELVINVFIFQNNYDITKNLFKTNGTCHIKNNDYTYKKYVTANHYSYNNLEFNKDDIVVRIVPEKNDMLIGLTNSFLRAGDTAIDLNHLEHDTKNKLKKASKGGNFYQLLANEHGMKESYNRGILRNYFYSMLVDDRHGVDMMTNFDSAAENFYEFPFRSFFSFDSFYRELNEIAKFFGFNFYPTTDLYRIHQQFLDINHGLQSEIKCKGIWTKILSGQHSKIDLNILEEAWVNWQIAQSFRAYELPELNGSNYPTDTQRISQIIFDWKSKDYPQC